MTRYTLPTPPAASGRRPLRKLPPAAPSSATCLPRASTTSDTSTASSTARLHTCPCSTPLPQHYASSRARSPSQRGTACQPLEELPAASVSSLAPLCPTQSTRVRLPTFSTSRYLDPGAPCLRTERPSCACRPSYQGCNAKHHGPLQACSML